MGFTNCETVEKKGFQKFNKGKKSSYKRDKKVGNQANMSGENKSTPIVKASDITDELKEDILAISKDALDNFQLERDIAGTVKKQLDVKYGNTWHVIVGKNFGSYVTHEKGHFVYFYIGPLAFLVFKTA